MIEEGETRDFREKFCILRPHEYLKLHRVTGVCKYTCDLACSYNGHYTRIDSGADLQSVGCRTASGIQQIILNL